MTALLLLMVEDSPSDVRLMRRTLADLGYHCDLEHIADGAKAIARISDGQARIADLILLDLNMPCRSGMDVLRVLQANTRWKCVPVIIMTNSLARRDVDAAYGSGANAYVIKPVSLDEYEQMISALAHFWLRIVRLPTTLTGAIA